MIVSPRQPEPMVPRGFRILCLDGGGLRGVFAATLIAEIEARTGVPFRTHFDLVCGTSTGAILALGLAFDIPASTIRDLYVNEGPEIFGKPRSKLPVILFGGPRHRPERLYSALQAAFGERVLRDAKVKLCIPTAGLHTGLIKVLKTPHAPGIFADADLPAWKVAAASGAAPTYLPPAELRGGDAFVDGGLWANSPTLVGITEGLRLGHSLPEIQLLSVGTGSGVVQTDPVLARSWGYVGWGRWLVEHVLALQQQAAHQHARLLGLGCYRRIDPVLAGEPIGLDDPKACAKLGPLAHQAFQEHYEDIRSVFLDADSPGGGSAVDA